MTNAESSLAAVEAHLASLGAALRARESIAIELCAAELHRALARLADCRAACMPPGAHERLLRLRAEVAAQSEAVARARAAIARSAEVLLPRRRGAGYDRSGAAESAARRGALSA